MFSHQFLPWVVNSSRWYLLGQRLRQFRVRTWPVAATISSSQPQFIYGSDLSPRLKSPPVRYLVGLTIGDRIAAGDYFSLMRISI
jgi:hypothetical protein